MLNEEDYFNPDDYNWDRIFVDIIRQAKNDIIDPRLVFSSKLNKAENARDIAERRRRISLEAENYIFGSRLEQDIAAFDVDVDPHFIRSNIRAIMKEHAKDIELVRNPASSYGSQTIYRSI